MHPRYSNILPFNEKCEISVPPVITLFLFSIAGFKHLFHQFLIVICCSLHDLLGCIDINLHRRLNVANERLLSAQDKTIELQSRIIAGSYEAGVSFQQMV